MLQTSVAKHLGRTRIVYRYSKNSKDMNITYLKQLFHETRTYKCNIFRALNIGNKDFLDHLCYIKIHKTSNIF